MNKLPLRSNVCMLLFNKKFQIFLGQRLEEPDVWQLPQGGVEKKHTLEENVIRELHEETGAARKNFQVVKRLKARHRYDFSKPPHYAKNKWRGQSQTFWLVKYLGKNRDIKLNRYKPEFSDYKWCTVDEVIRLAEPKRVKGYRKPLAEFTRFVNQLKRKA